MHMQVKHALGQNTACVMLTPMGFLRQRLPQMSLLLPLQFPDAVAPYLHFGNTMQQRFPGTFFRFPLRFDAPSPFHVSAYVDIELSLCPACISSLLEGFLFALLLCS